MRGLRSPLRRLAVALAAALLPILSIAVGAVPAHAAGTNFLLPGQTLPSGDYLNTGNFQLFMGTDGNVVADACSHAVWASGSMGHSGAHLVMQADGNLVAYDPSGRAIWNTGTNGHPGAWAQLQSSDGELVIWNSNSSAILWRNNAGGAPNCADRLWDGSLPSGHWLISQDQSHIFGIGYGGQMAIYHNGSLTWLSQCAYGGSVIGMAQGNLILVMSNGWPACSTQTGGHNGAYAQMQNDGNLVIYTDWHTVVWASGTSGR